MVRFKDILRHVKQLRNEGVPFRYNDGGAIIGERYGTDQPIYYLVAQLRHPKETRQYAAERFERESPTNVNDFYTAAGNYRRRGRRASWMRRLIVEACGLPNFVREPAK